MFIQHRTLGFVLKKENRGEADQFFWIYTKDYGKIVVLAKAIRKPGSKLRSAIDVFYFSEIEFIQGRAQKTLTDAFLVERLVGIRRDLQKLRLAYRFSRVLSQLIKNQEPDQRLWRLLESFFKSLDQEKLSFKTAVLFYYYFFWNLLKTLGYQPELYHCLFCRKKIVSFPILFSWRDGGLICYSCQKRVISTFFQVRPETIKVLRLIFSQNWLTVRLIKTNTGLFNDLKIFSKKYFGSLSIP